MPTAISEFTGEPVDTASEAWRWESEVRHIVDGFQTREARLAFLYGLTDGNGKKVRKGVADYRGLAAAKQLQEDAMRLWEIRQARKVVAGAGVEPASR